MENKKKEFCIYIHWPFCLTKCPYCDFNTHIKKNIDEEEWLEPYLISLDYWKSKYSGKEVKSIFFGGGTPSLMSPKIVGSILNKIYKLWVIKEEAEITLEANPNSIDLKNLKILSEIGINRTSLGIQALDDNDLKLLGRNHTKKEALVSLETCKSLFDNVSFDLIYGRQFQKLKEWENELSNALKIDANHISLYMLTIEKGTKFYEMKKKGELLGLPNQAKEVKLFEITDEICKNFNYMPYEISNYTKNNKPCIHNLNYWKYGDYIGIGPGAHGRITKNHLRYRTETPKSPDKWKFDILNKNISNFLIKEIFKEEQKQEYIMTSLRLVEGLNKTKLYNINNRKLPEKQIQFLKEYDLITESANFIKTTKKGKLFINKIIFYLNEVQ